MSTAQVQQRKKRGRPRLSNALVQFRLPWNDSRLLAAICKYEERDRSELFRAEFLKMKRQYRRDPLFRKWVAKHADELVAEGIKPEEILP